MKPNAAAQIRQEEDRKSRRAAKDRRRSLEERRRQMQAERNRLRKRLLLLLLWLLESAPVRAFFDVQISLPHPTLQQRQPKPARKSAKNRDLGAEDDPRSEYERLYLCDRSTRYGEEHLEVVDGLTWNDIVALNRQHRPHLSPKFTPIPGMPGRYIAEPVHVWTLLDHLHYEFLRKDAIAALKLIVDPTAHEWIDACASTSNGWKQLCYCRGRTPHATIAEFPRASERWREEQRREADERKKEAKETPDNGPRPPGSA
ncbi:hypothetical protein ACC772_20095 [Rhizobium ruizarguesonis]|uniref:hypothetical protein n=1 Tax=Rhizobium laguerreae TaxID=1076926 RepID=UPI001C91CB89|nr:hypothetical protein [Rhizobium laguerreae]MBY3387616.1 hypothetical protein [Rhizobium laguerreae]MBY3401366.1 hypothetical protein [Rhizobium laguerreae]MBY3408304.1 hypothetical protein [Rhizobium laguerreae]